MSEEIALAAADRAEIVRLHAIVAQQQRALEAERRAREIAQADVAAIQQVIRRYLDDATVSPLELSECLYGHPGAPLLVELDNLRALKRAVVRYFNMREMAHAAAAGNEDIAAMLDALAATGNHESE